MYQKTVFAWFLKMQVRHYGPSLSSALICDLPSVVNCLFHMFTAAHLEAVLVLPPDQQSGIHCQIICGIELLTRNILGRTCSHVYSLDITQCQRVRGVMRDHALQIDISY